MYLVRRFKLSIVKSNDVVSCFYRKFIIGVVYVISNMKHNKNKGLEKISGGSVYFRSDDDLYVSDVYPNPKYVSVVYYNEGSIQYTFSKLVGDKDPIIIEKTNLMMIFRKQIHLMSINSFNYDTNVIYFFPIKLCEVPTKSREVPTESREVPTNRYVLDESVGRKYNIKTSKINKMYINGR